MDNLGWPVVETSFEKARSKLPRNENLSIQTDTSDLFRSPEGKLKAENLTTTFIGSFEIILKYTDIVLHHLRWPVGLVKC